MAITDLDRFEMDRSLDRISELAQAAAPGRVAIELRDRSRPVAEMLAFGERARALARRSGQLFVVNDRLDLALLLEADGVHLGEGSVASHDARTLLGERFVIRACHDPDGCADVDADIVLLSPVLEARKNNPALGLSAIQRASRALGARSRPMQLFALGGVDAANAAACISAGAHGIAAISSIFCASDLGPLLRALGIERT